MKLKKCLESLTKLFASPPDKPAETNETDTLPAETEFKNMIILILTFILLFLLMNTSW